MNSGKEVAESWTTLGTAEARADTLFEGVKARLDGEKVPTPDHGLDDLGKAAGVFHSRLWKIFFDRAAFSPTSIDDDDAREVASTVYHEGRDAEQHHKMARMLATKGQQIRAKMNNPIHVGRSRRVAARAAGPRR